MGPISQLQARLSQPPAMLSSEPSASSTVQAPISVLCGNQEQLRYLLQRGTNTSATEFTSLISPSGGTEPSSVGMPNQISSVSTPNPLNISTSQSTFQGVTTTRVWVPGTKTERTS
jgi:hypothetical protein